MPYLNYIHNNDDATFRGQDGNVNITEYGYL